MRSIVSDTSCMIDLGKAALLEAILALPYRFLMPDVLFENEWLDLSASVRRVLYCCTPKGWKCASCQERP